MDYDERERKREKQRLSLKQTHYIIKCPSEQYADVTGDPKELGVVEDCVVFNTIFTMYLTKLQHYALFGK